MIKGVAISSAVILLKQDTSKELSRVTISTNQRKEFQMIEITKPNEPTKPIVNETQRGFSVVEVLFTVATIGAAVLGAALSDPKLPPALCE